MKIKVEVCCLACLRWLKDMNKDKDGWYRFPFATCPYCAERVEIEYETKEGTTCD